MALRANRMARELKLLSSEPPPGVAVWPVGDGIGELRAQLRGPEGTVYEGGTFDLSVSIPERYPIEPPRVRFVTPVLHPNIDGGGRVCLDTLSLPPKGSWRPSLSLGAALGAVRALLSEPNGDDGLVEEVAHEFRHARAAFDARARAMTRKHASGLAGGRREEAAAKGEEAAAKGEEAEEEQEAKEGKVEEKENKASSSSSPAASEKRQEARSSLHEDKTAAAAAALSAAPVSRLQLGVKRARAAEKEEDE